MTFSPGPVYTKTEKSHLGTGVTKCWKTSNISINLFYQNWYCKRTETNFSVEFVETEQIYINSTIYLGKVMIKICNVFTISDIFGNFDTISSEVISYKLKRSNFKSSFAVKRISKFWLKFSNLEKLLLVPVINCIVDVGFQQWEEKEKTQ